MFLLLLLEFSDTVWEAWMVTLAPLSAVLCPGHVVDAAQAEPSYFCHVADAFHAPVAAER